MDCQQYNTKRTNITWEKCSLRKWLNGAFVKEAFSKEERELIPKITVSADKNPDYNTNAGKDTEDQVFLLSIAEADRYFASDEERKCRPTTHAIAQGCKPDMFIGTCWWWLRSPGSISYYAAGVLSRGSVYCDGHSVDRDYNAVRPALWINLDS